MQSSKTNLGIVFEFVAFAKTSRFPSEWEFRAMTVEVCEYVAVGKRIFQP